MALTNLAVAEEALSLLPAERAELANLPIQSLENGPRTGEKIKADLPPPLQGIGYRTGPGIDVRVGLRKSDVKAAMRCYSTTCPGLHVSFRVGTYPRERD